MGIGLAWMLATRFWPLLVVIAAIGAGWWALAWHAGKVSDLKRIYFAAGERAERDIWEEAKRQAAIARTEELRRAAAKLATLELALVREEAADEAAVGELRRELERALAATPPHHAPAYVIPDAVLAPLRKIK